MTLQHSWRRWGVAVVTAWLGVTALNRSMRRVVGASMLPTLAEGDLVVAVRWPRPRPGDVVVARDPRDGQPWVKRLAAVGPARVNGDGGTVTVPAGQVLLLGDNPMASTDGRVLGPTPRADVTHRVVAALTRTPERRPALRRVRNRTGPSAI